MTDIRITLDEETKRKADILFGRMGTNINNAVKMFISQALNDGGFPFQPHSQKLPSKESLKALQELQDGDYTTSTLEEFQKELSLLNKPK